MKKLITLFLIATLATSVGWADEYSYTFTSKQFSTNGSKDLGGVTWTLSGDGNYWGYDGTKGQQFGSGTSPYKTLSLTTSGISGTIQSVAVNASTANSASANISISVGGTTYLSNQSLTSTATTYTSSGNASGTIVISMSQTTSKALYIKSITVTYSTGSSATVQEPTLTDEFTFWPVMNEAASATVTITPASGNTVRYTTNGSTPSRTNGTEITAATTINISGTTTVKAISYVGTQTSSVVSKTYTLGQTVTGIAAFKNLTSGTTVRLYLPDANNARTLFVKGNDAFVRDNSGAICIYNVTTNPPLAYNQHIAGWIIGTYTNYNNLPEFTASSATNSCYLVIADPVTEADVEPVEIEADNYNDYYADWVTISDLQVTAASGSTATATAGNSSFSIYNKYNPDYYQLPYVGAIVDISGIAAPYNNTQQLRPIYQNDNWPITYVVDAQEGFVAPDTDIANAQVRLKRNLIPQDWSVLTVPFELEDFEGDVLQYTGVTLGEVGNYEMSGQTYPIYSGVMQFEDYYGPLQPGTPYLVKPYTLQHGMTHNGVTLKAGTAGAVTKTLAAQQNAPGINLMANEQPVYAGDYSLVGTYSPTTLPQNESTVVILDSNNLSWTSLVDDTSVGGTEGYITVPNGAGVKLALPGSEVITGVVDIRLDNNTPKDAVIYNILGQRLTRPLSELPPGVYIVNGKKIVKR
ncbi:MAG: chitobiase/beta-hexosaminidase C-terminal domain-containing protein [Muribaculaceae bacterium]|nr:chitobiase/beta-hexosaminidase C-terminal domain-containing protein [Muribaculaceae bacterium]